MSVRVPLSVHFPGAGPHDVSLQLPDDELPGDNRRWAAVPVKDSLLIRLVDGEPSSEPFGSEIDYLAAPLSVGVGAAEAWRVEVALDNDFLSPRRETPDVMVLANVAAPTVEQAETLGRLVREGMGLMIFTGAKLDAGLYNDLLYRQGTRLLPCALKSLVDETIRGLIVEPVRPSPLEKLLELKPSALERVAARQIMAVDEPTDKDQARVLARWNDPGRSPAIVERVVGDGRVLLWTTTADRAGNDWPIEPSFVLAVREAVLGTARPTPLANTVTAGERMRQGRPLQPGDLERPAQSARRRRAALADGGAGSRGPGRPRPGRRDRGPRHPPARSVSRVLGRGDAGQPAGYLRGQPRPAREQPRADRGGRREIVVRPAGRRDRLGQVRRRRLVLPDRSRDLARPGVWIIRPPARGVDLRHLGRTLPMKPKPIDLNAHE